MQFKELLHTSSIKDNNAREMLREIEEFDLDNHRNILIFGKNSSGKTYLLEMILKSAGVLQQDKKNITIQYIPLTRIFRSELLKNKQISNKSITLEKSIDENKNRSKESWINDGTIERAVKYAREKHPDFIENVMSYIFNADTKEEKKTLKKEIFKDEMSDGYKSVLAIISLIIYGTSYSETTIDGEKLNTGRSVVLIDEIDAYVHQSVEVEIANKIIEIFPQCKFIITTHSPLVIRNTKKSLLYNMESRKLKVHESYYNEKTDTIYEDIFEVNLENKLINKYNKVLKNLIEYKENSYTENQLRLYKKEIEIKVENKDEEIQSEYVLFNTLLKLINFYIRKDN